MSRWPSKALGDIADVGAGNSAPQDQSLFEDGTFPFIRTSDVGKIRVGEITSSADLLNDSGIKKLKRKPAGTILFPKSGASTFLNHRVVMAVDGYVSSHLATIKADNKNIIDRFLFWVLTTIKAQDMIQDHKYPSLKLSDLKNIQTPTPPFAEQKRIVAILDEAFEGIDKAVANTEKNLASARALFELYLARIFGARRDGWKATNLGNLASFRNGLNFTKNSTGERVSIVGVKDFQNNFYVPFNELDSVNIDGALQEKDELRDGDIFAVRSNGNKELIGRCLLATNVVPKTSHSGFTIRIRLDSEDISPVFLTHFLKSHECRRQLIESGGGANISSLNQRSLASLPILYPSRDEQDAIVHQIEAVSGQTHKLESIFQQRLDLLADLKQSILQKAFSGELTSDGKHEDAAA